MASVSEVLVEFLAAQQVDEGVPFFGGVFAIFGHGNVAGLGPALGQGTLPVIRPHNEQGMGMAAVAYAKAHRRRRAFVCTTSIGPGATNLVTPAAVAHVSRLPVLLLLGEAFADRGPDPVLQQLEHPDDPSRTANDCFRPVARYFDRIGRPEQLIPSLEQAMGILTDPVDAGPAVLALPQDVQVEPLEVAPAHLQSRRWPIRRPRPDAAELATAARMVAASRRPFLVVGGGAVYAGAEEPVAAWMNAGVPAATTHAGRDAVSSRHPQMLGGLGATGTEPANRAVREADLVVIVGSRMTDFTTGSRALFEDRPRLHVNVNPKDASKHGAVPLVADAWEGLEALRALGLPPVDPDWSARWAEAARAWWEARAEEPRGELLTDGQVLDGVAGWAQPDTTVVAASGSIPAEMQKRWRGPAGVGTHVEYGFSAMGYELAGALGVKLARPGREVVALLGDGAYLMLNGELETAARLGVQLIAVVFDNGGFGCIHRLQGASQGPSFANLIGRRVDLVAHARSLGARAVAAGDGQSLRSALDDAREHAGVSVVVVPTDPDAGTGSGGAPWRVPGATGPGFAPFGAGEPGS